MELDEFRAGVDAWLDEHADELAPTSPAPGTLDEQMAQLSKVKRLAFDAGWMRHGWPERVGGLGGSALLRAYLGEALTARDLVEPGIYSMTEVLAPTMIDYASPELAADDGAPPARGATRRGARGSPSRAPGATSAALSCRATRTDDGWQVTGQKVWTSLAQYAQRCVLLDPHRHRRSPPTAASPPCSSTWTRPGSRCDRSRPCTGSPEFCEVFFDDVLVPARAHRSASEGQGWAVAMDLLPYERSTALWHPRPPSCTGGCSSSSTRCPTARSPRRRSARCSSALRVPGPLPCHSAPAGRGGASSGPRPRSTRSCWPRPSRRVFDLAADGLLDEVLLGDDVGGERWRPEFLYSRAATIYGGSAEIQRNIIARRLLDLGNDR